MPSRRYCVYNCSGVRRLFQFPNEKRDQERRAEWLQVVGLDSNDHRTYLYLCEKHFTISVGCSHRHKLPSDAVPDINLCQQHDSPEIQHAPETPATPTATKSTNFPLKLLTPVQTTKKSFIYVLEPANTDDNAQNAPAGCPGTNPLAKTCSVVASARTATQFYHKSDQNTATPIQNNASPKNVPYATGSSSSVISKSLAPKRPSPLLTSSLNATPLAPKKLFSVLRPSFAAVQSTIPPNATKASHNQRNLNNDVAVNSNVELRAAANSSTESFVITTNSKTTNVHNSSQKLHQLTINFSTCPKTTLSNPAVARVQTEPKTFIIVRPPGKEGSTTEARVPSTSNSAISVHTIEKPTAPTKLEDTSAGSDATIPAAPKPLFSVLRLPSRNTIGSNSIKTILIPQKTSWKPQKFIIKRHEVKQLAVAPANSAITLENHTVNKPLAPNIAPNTTGSVGTAQVKLTTLCATPSNLATVGTAPISTPTVNAAVVNPTIHNIIASNPSAFKVSPVNTTVLPDISSTAGAINISLLPNPVTNDNSDFPSFLASNPTVQSRSEFFDSPFTTPRLNPAKRSSNAGTIEPPISCTALSVFIPESKGYRVHASSVEAAVDPLAIDARISRLAGVILEKRQAKSAVNISSSSCHKQANETARKENGRRSIDEIVENNMKANNARNCEMLKFGDQWSTTTGNERVPVNSEASLLELQKQILCLKQKLESKEMEVAKLQSTMLNIAAK